MTTRTITGPLRKPDGSVWASATVTFKLQTNFATATDATIPHSTVTATTDVNGDFSVSLEVPATNAWRWHCILPDNSLFAFNLGAGASTNLHTLIADANLGDTVSASTLADAIADKADKVTPSATNNVALLGADGNLVDSGLGTGDIGGTADHGDLTGLGDDDHTQYHNDARGDARYSQLGHNHDHGALTGLGDDDHTIYLLADGTRALAGAWDMGDQALTNVNIDSGTIDGNAIGDLATTGDIVTDHGALTGLGDDDHTIYLLADGSRNVTGALVMVASGAGATPLTIKMAGSPTVSPVILTNSSDVSLWELTETGAMEVRNRSNTGDPSNDRLLVGIDSDGTNRVELDTNAIRFKYASTGNAWWTVEQDTTATVTMYFGRPTLAGMGGNLKGGANVIGGTGDGLAMAPAESNRQVGFTNHNDSVVGLVLNADLSGNMDARFGGTDATADDAQVAILNDTTTDNALLLRAAASQSAAVLLIENSAGTDQFSIDSNFILNFDMTMGNGTEDPTTDAPDDWIQVNIGGATRYVPVYT